MSEGLNPNWFEITISCRLWLTFEQWNNCRNTYFEILRSKISPLIQELKSLDLISSWHILNHTGLDLRLLLHRTEDVSKVEAVLEKHGLNLKLGSCRREKSKSNEDRILELLSEITLILIDHNDLTTFLLQEGPIHYISNQLGLSNFAEADLYLQLSNDWFFTHLSRSNAQKKADAVNEVFRQFRKQLKFLLESM